MSTQRRFNVDVTALDAIRWVITALLISVILVPVLYAFSVSIRPQPEVFGPVHFIPNEPTLEPWISFITDNARQLLNSVIIATGVSIISLLIAVPGAYAFSRLEFPGRTKLFYMIILIMLVPGIMLIVPILDMWRNAGLYNTVSGLWLALMIGAMPVSIWILRDNFQKLPPNAEEAAQVYGATQFGAFTRVVLPLATPAIIAVAFLNFLGAWNNFLFTNLMATSEGPLPAIVVLFRLLSPDKATTWPYALAAAFVIAIPPATFYLLARRYLESALEF